MNLASTSLILFLVLDPFGNMVMFHTLLERLPAERRLRVLLRELVIAFAILLFFLFAGSEILGLLGIRPATLSISGGILLFLIALGMVFPTKAMLMISDTSEPFIVPLAVPMIAGPSAIALLLLIASKSDGHLAGSALALSIAWAATAIVLSVAPWFLRLLGSKGTQALERLMGLLLILIAVQMLLDGFAQAQILRPLP